MESWQKNIAASFLAQLLAMTAFAFVDALLPLCIQKVGRLTTKEAAFWSGEAASGFGVARSSFPNFGGCSPNASGSIWWGCNSIADEPGYQYV